MLSVVMLNIVMLSVVMLSVVASDSQLWLYYELCDFGLMAMVEEPLPLIKILLSQPIVECLFSLSLLQKFVPGNRGFSQKF